MATTERSTGDWLVPRWAASPAVRAMSTLRTGGVSAGPWGLADGSRGGWNLGARCGDRAQDVRRNRALLRELVPAEPLWLEQVHGVDVFDADREPAPAGGPSPRADAAVTTRRGVVLAVLTADCLPVVLTNAGASAIGVAHAGWRGLAGGVIERTVEALARASDDHRWIAWLGPAIGPTRFEVGSDVLSAFVERDPGAAEAFVAGPAPDKWFADLFTLARRSLSRAGVESVGGGGLCTASEPSRFYSFRRDRVTGRMASLIWID